MLLTEATVVLVALSAWLLQHLRLMENQNHLSQGQLNDLVHNIGISKESSEILTFHLGEHGYT